MTSEIMRHCCLCPRKCGADRTKTVGFCGESDKVRIARADLHKWEEPCISGSCGAGTVFFSGCSLKCCFCQNYEISAQGKGFEISVEELAQTFLMLQQKGAHNIDLVSPTHFVPQICDALDMIKGELRIPVVYNCGGYELPETLELLGDRVSVFLPDLKFFDGELAQRCCLAGDYFENTMAAIEKMVSIAGKPQFDENGLITHGVIVRHLVLPNHRHDSIRLVNELAQRFKPSQLLISLMSQYVPLHKALEHSDLSRRTSTFEYNSVLKEIEKVGFDGYFQQRSSAEKEYIPTFFDKKNY